MYIYISCVPVCLYIIAGWQTVPSWQALEVLIRKRRLQKAITARRPGCLQGVENKSGFVQTEFVNQPPKPTKPVVVPNMGKMVNGGVWGTGYLTFCIPVWSWARAGCIQ